MEWYQLGSVLISCNFGHRTCCALFFGFPSFRASPFGDGCREAVAVVRRVFSALVRSASTKLQSQMWLFECVAGKKLFRRD